MERDIQLEKFLEMMVEQFAHDLGESAEECPVLKSMIECLSAVKASNNAEIRIEMGIVGTVEKSACPCERRYTQK
ncbi:MAG: hypothetical protein ACPLPV_03510 [Methanomassiliicoccales archaeon]|jgi:hypothetical protein